MRSISGDPAASIRLDALTVIDRRIAGMQRAVDRILVVPLMTRTKWEQGQLKYFQREIVKLRKQKAILTQQGQ